MPAALLCLAQVLAAQSHPVAAQDEVELVIGQAPPAGASAGTADAALSEPETGAEAPAEGSAPAEPDEAELIPKDSDGAQAAVNARSIFVSATFAPQVRWLRDDLAVPLPGSPASGRDIVSRLYADVRANPEIARTLSLHLSARLNWIEPIEGRYSDNRLRVDAREAFLTWSPNPEVIIETGRINARVGVALGYNPTDFFRGRTVVDPVTVDPSVLRLNRLGVAMARLTGLRGPAAVALSVAPRLEAREPVVFGHRSFADLRLGRTNAATAVELRGGWEFPGGTSLQLSAFVRERRAGAFGLNLVTGLGDSATIFLEATARKTSDVLSEAVAEGVASGELPPFALQIFPAATSRYRHAAALGITYTTSSKMTLTVEFDLNGAGLTKGQWHDRVDGALARGVLGSGAFWYARSLVQQQQELISRQQLFVRAAWDEAFGRKQLSLSTLLLSPITDRSGLLQSAVDYRLSNGWSLGGLVQISTGPRRSIYGSSPQAGGIQLYATRYF
jgi:hypothetical protein